MQGIVFRYSRIGGSLTAAVCRDLRRTYRATVNHRIPDRTIRDGGYANGYTVTRQKGYTIKKEQHRNMIKKGK